MRRQWTIAILTLAAISLAGGVLAHPGHDEIDRRDEPTTELHGDQTSEGRSRRVILLRRHGEAADVQVGVHSHIHSGRVSWRLVHPRGEEVFALVADDGKIRGGSGRIDCARGRCAGEWRLELEVEGDVTWTLRTWGLAITEGPGKRAQSR